ncbi:inorganic diphosphatase [Candidatus Bathyarchaeota archaeon]|nr:inorganic diphosphatase [Candidatus Bathyarchaeota archaeon]MBS7630050.1 inorganic diphosphatase [Candidatus Bathyarchaeota archaeon]
MIDYWTSIPSGPNPPREVYVVIEMTRGGRNKYEYDIKKGVFQLNRVLYTYFPCDYGFIPQTLDDDGDPLDAVLLIDEPTFTGCVVLARPVGNIKMLDEGIMDDKILTVSTSDPFYGHIRSLRDIPQSVIRELTYFFDNYKRAEGKTTKVQRWEDVDEAMKIIEWTRECYKNKQKK